MSTALSSFDAPLARWLAESGPVNHARHTNNGVAERATPYISLYVLSVMTNLPDACSCDAVGDIGCEREHVLVVDDTVGGRIGIGIPRV